MIKLIDFTNCKLSSRNLEYAGRAGEKRGIIYNDEFWFLKFPKNTIGMNKVAGLSYVTSPLSEYIGSHIYKILGYDVHDTILGICNDGKRDKVVCACKDFIDDDRNELLIPYTALRNDTNPIVMDRDEETTKSASNINEIIFQLKNNTILGSIDDAWDRFWDVVIIDMLINNNDRNEDNWGVIKYKKENEYKLAPIYDCGNCFYGKTSDDRIKSILDSTEKLKSSAINGITAYEDDNEKRITNLEVINYINKYALNNLKRICENVKNHLSNITDFINSIPDYYNNSLIMSDERKEYYLATLKIRLDELINSCKNDKKELEYEGLKKRRIYFDEDRQIVTYKIKIYGDYLCLYPNGFKLENTSVMPSVVHYENKLYVDIPRDEFDSFVRMKTEYLKIFVVKGIKYDLFIHQNGKKKEVIQPEDEINGVHIIKEDDLNNYLNNLELCKEKNIYKI